MLPNDKAQRCPSKELTKPLFSLDRVGSPVSNVSFEFSGETVVVTGSSSGIGRAIALAFRKAGATVLNGDIRADPKVGDTSTHRRIRAVGGKSLFVETDVSEPEQLRALADRADEYGGLDVLVNNAGVFADVPFREVDESVLNAHYEVNIKGVYFGCQAAADKMWDDGGVIVNVASISSRVAQGALVHYEATKGAIEMITRGTALELAPKIPVNAVAPGIVPTELYEGYSEKYHDEEELEELVKPIPIGRAGTPEEVAQTTLYLASDAASYTTGETLFVDGGWMTL
jgi:NAD(P)-dependent dehydrogenase (short-subunit alcohol dehydrogenase family)